MTEATKLKELPAAVAKSLVEALRFSGTDNGELVRAALLAVKFPFDDGSGLQLASKLTRAQRTVAEILACRSQPHTMTFNGYRIPQETWCQRRWLGIDSGGVLEAKQGKEPLWRVLQKCWSDGTAMAEREELLASYPLAKRLEVYCLLALEAYNLDSTYLPEFSGLDEIDTSSGRWAAGFADFAIGLSESFAPEKLKSPLYLALVRGKQKPQERWDRLVPVCAAPAIARECLETLPAARRESAIVTQLELNSGLGPVECERILRSLLTWFPSRALEKLLPKQRTGARRLKLRFVHTLNAKRVSELTVTQRDQFALFGIGDHEVGLLDWLDVLDTKGRRVYEMVINSRSDGGVFEIGTTEEIASFSQGGLNICDDADLGAALEHGFQGAEWKRSKKPRRN